MQMKLCLNVVTSEFDALIFKLLLCSFYYQMQTRSTKVQTEMIETANIDNRYRKEGEAESQTLKGSDGYSAKCLNKNNS